MGEYVGHGRRWVQRVAASVSILAAAALTGPAYAQTCVGFSDVSASDAFCPNVEWLKNRAITLGCAVSLYCPDSSVTRRAMAAFMNRLGVVLSPENLQVQASPGPINIDAATIICQSADVVPRSYARTAIGTYSVSGRSTAALGISTRAVISVDGGALWSDIPGVVPMRTQTEAAGWAYVGGSGNFDLAPNATVRFGISISRVTGAGAGNVSDSSCQLDLQILNQNPTSPPF